MSDASTLWLLALGLYLAETVLLVPLGAPVFRRLAGESFHAAKPFYVRRHRGPGLVVGLPVPPFGLLVVGGAAGELTAGDEVTERVASWVRATRWVRAAAIALFLATFVGAGLVVWAPSGPWGAWSGAPVFALIGLLWVVTGVLAVRVRRRQPASRRAPVRDLVTALSSPLAAMRVHDVLGRGEFADLSELTLATALLPEAEWAAVVRGALLRARREGFSAEADLATALLAHGIDASAILAPLAREDPGSRSYCPGCLAEYTLTEGLCSTCPDTALVAFEG